MRKNGTVESDREFHFAGILLIAASVVAGLILSLLVASHEQTARAQAQPAGVAEDSPAPVKLFTTPTPPVVYVAVPRAAPTASAVPIPTASPTSPALAGPAATSTSSPAMSTSSSPATPKQGRGDAVAGASVFANQCGSCHPGGGAGLGPAVKGLPADLIRETVRSGKGIMPSFVPGNLGDQQLLDMIAFLENGS